MPEFDSARSWFAHDGAADPEPIALWQQALAALEINAEAALPDVS